MTLSGRLWIGSDGSSVRSDSWKRTATTMIAIAILSFSFPAEPTSLPDPEVPPVKRAGDLLPPELIEGEDFRVLDEIGNYDSLNIYRIESDFGELEAYGELEFRVRLREIKATRELQEVSRAKVAAGSAGQAVVGTGKAVGQVAAHPVRTAKSLPGGIQRRFKSWGRTAKEVNQEIKDARAGKSEKRSKSRMAKDVTRWYFDVDAAERKWAQRVGVDPYSTYPPLRTELSRVGKFDAGAAKGVSFVGPRFPKELDYVKEAYNLVWSIDPGELREMQVKALGELGAGPDLIEAFLAVEALTPSLMTFLITALLEMEGVEERNIPIEQALTVQTLTDALFHIECVVMASWFHTQEAELERFVRGTMVPVGMTSQGRLIVFSAADFAYWSEITATSAMEFTEIYRLLSESREVLLAGRATPRFIEGVETLGWGVRTHLRQKILPRLPWATE